MTAEGHIDPMQTHLSRDARQLFEEAVRLIREQHDHTGARRLLIESLRSDPKNDMAWVWLSRTTNDHNKRRDCLQRALKLNPANTQAQRLLRLMTTAEAAVQNAASATDTVTGPLPVVQAAENAPFAAEISTEPAKTGEALPVVHTERQPPPLVTSPVRGGWRGRQLLGGALLAACGAGLGLQALLGGTLLPAGQALILTVSALVIGLGVMRLLYGLLPAPVISANEHGLRAGQRGWRWEQISAVTINHTRWQVAGLPLGQDYWLHLEADGKPALRLDSRHAQFEHMNSLILERCLPPLLQRDLLALRAGETLRYGPVQVNREGILTGGRLLAWDKLVNCDLREGEAVLQGRGDSPGALLPVLGVRNGLTLLALAQRILMKSA